MPGPPEVSRQNGTRSLLQSQAASRSAVGFCSSALTRPPVIAPCSWSTVAASSDRQGVALVQLRSVSPGLYPAASAASASAAPWR